MGQGQATSPEGIADAFSQYITKNEDTFSDATKSAILALIHKLQQSNYTVSTVKKTDNSTIIRVDGNCSLVDMKDFVMGRLSHRDSLFTNGIICYAEQEQAITFVNGTKGKGGISSKFKVKFILTGRPINEHIKCVVNGVYNKGTLQKYEHNVDINTLRFIEGKMIGKATGVDGVLDYIKLLNYSNKLSILNLKHLGDKRIGLKVQGVNWETLKTLYTQLSNYINYLQLVKHESVALEITNFGSYGWFQIFKVSKDMKLYAVCTILVDVKLK